MQHSSVAWRVVLFARLSSRRRVDVFAERVRSFTFVGGRGVGAVMGGPVQRVWGRRSKMEGRREPRIARRKKGQDRGWGRRSSNAGRRGVEGDGTMGFVGS